MFAPCFFFLLSLCSLSFHDLVGRSRKKTGEGGCRCGREVKRTDLVQLHQKVLCTLVVEQRLGRFAVGTVTLGEDDDGIVVDDLLCFGFGGHDGVGAE